MVTAVNFGQIRKGTEMPAKSKKLTVGDSGAWVLPGNLRGKRVAPGLLSAAILLAAHFLLAKPMSNVHAKKMAVTAAQGNAASLK